MNILESMLNNYPKEEFLKKHFAKIPFSKPDAAKHLIHLLNWDVVNHILKEKKSITRIVKNGIVTQDYADIDSVKATDYYKYGHTLLLRYAEKSHSLLNNLAQDFSKSFLTEVDIQLYCTPEGQNAFGWHYDIEEVFIIQTAGSKLYTIRNNTIHPKPLLSSIPKDLQFEKETSDLQLQVLLEPGDWLYIPSGWWHIAQTQSASMHISVGLMPRSAIDIIGFLETYLVKFPEWRTRFPKHKNISLDQEMELYRQPLIDLGLNLAQIFRQDDFVKSFIHYYKNV